MTNLSVQNIEEEWKPLNDRQKIKQIDLSNNQSVFIIVPNDYEDLVVPLFCPLCQLPMTTKEDTNSYKKHKLCEQCHYKWNVDGTPIDYKELTKQKEFKEYLANKKFRSRPNINIK